MIDTTQAIPIKELRLKTWTKYISNWEAWICGPVLDSFVFLSFGAIELALYWRLLFRGIAVLLVITGFLVYGLLLLLVKRKDAQVIRDADLSTMRVTPKEDSIALDSTINKIRNDGNIDNRECFFSRQLAPLQYSRLVTVLPVLSMFPVVSYERDWLLYVGILSIGIGLTPFFISMFTSIHYKIEGTCVYIIKKNHFLNSDVEYVLCLCPIIIQLDPMDKSLVMIGKIGDTLRIHLAYISNPREFISKLLGQVA